MDRAFQRPELVANFKEIHLLSSLPADTPVLLAYSGGLDSTVLLHLLVAYAQEHHTPITAFHVQHGIRGVASLSDRDFCKKEAERLGVPFVSVDIDVPASALENRQSLETEARRLRYACFGKYMQENNIPILATAHHADDNLETVLFRLGRGTGLSGLCGILPSRPFSESCSLEHAVVVRPLLEIGKSDLKDFCVANGWPFVQDETNEADDASRNMIRHHIVPVLNQLGQHPEIAVSRLCVSLREDESFLEEQASKLYLDLALTDNNRICFERSRFFEQHEAMRVRLLRLAAVRLSGLVPDYEHVRRFACLQQDAVVSEQWSSQLTVTADKDTITLALPKPKKGADLKSIPLAFGTSDWPEFDFSLTLTDSEDEGVLEKPFIHIPSKLLDEGQLHFRSRLAGDKIRCAGKTLDVRKVINASSVQPERRSQLPLLVSGDEVLWIPLPGAEHGRVADALDPLVYKDKLLLHISYGPSWFA